MLKKRCFFHPERDADVFCEKCGKFLCNDCQYLFKFRHTSRNPAGGEIIIPQILCADCYKTQMKNREKARLWYIISLVVILVISGTITWIWIRFS